MGWEKGISRIGTVAGVVPGAIYSLIFYLQFNQFEDHNKWVSKSERFSDCVVYIGPIVLAVLFFFGIFFMVKTVFNIAIWIIHGFTE